MMQRFRKKRKFFKLPNLFLVGFIGFSLIGVFFTFQSKILDIKSINISVENIRCTDSESIKSSTNLQGKNFLLINSSEIRQNLMNKFFCIKEVNISRHFPLKVNLSVKGREAVAKLSKLEVRESTTSASLENIATPSAQASSGFLVDNEGVVFSQENLTDIPVIFFNDLNITLGDRLTDKSKNSLKILEKVKSFGVDVKILEIRGDYLIIFSSPKIIFKLEKIETQIASLQLILNKAKIDNNRLEFIDLRFDKPVVKIAPKKK